MYFSALIMKAIILHKFGRPGEVLKLENLPVPEPGDNEILVRIYTTTVNDFDWALVRGRPLLYRFLFGLFKPKLKIPGMELAGIIEKIGVKVKDFEIGDAVFGDTSGHGFGTFAEYIVINEKAVIKKPDEISFEEAASLPHASALALQALIEIAGIRPGQKVLINGGGGGVGTLGLQIAKYYDCDVSGVDSGDKFNMMRSIGYDHVIDYRKVNFTKSGEKYDLILDCKTDKQAPSYRRALNPGGIYVSVGGQVTKLMGLFFWSGILNVFSSKKLRILALKPNKGLDFIVDLYKQKKLKCILDGPYILEKAPELIQYFGKGKHKGKIVIRVK